MSQDMLRVLVLLQLWGLFAYTIWPLDLSRFLGAILLVLAIVTVAKVVYIGQE